MDELLVTFLCPIRIDGSNKLRIDEQFLAANKGVEGVSDMLNSLKNNCSGKHKWEIIFKIDEDDNSAINWFNSVQNEYPYPRAVFSPRGSNLPKAQYKVIHEWLNECYAISKKSKWYWLWNHANLLETEDTDLKWDEVIAEKKDKFIWPRTDVHKKKPSMGNLFPVISGEIVEERKSVGDGSPFDIYWEGQGSKEVKKEDRLLIITDVTVQRDK